MKYLVALGFSMFHILFAVEASADPGGIQCMHQSMNCLVNGQGCCDNSGGSGGLIPIPTPGPDPAPTPDPDPSVVVYPPGYPAGYPGAAVAIPASQIPGLFTSATYSGTIPGALVFRPGGWVAYSADGIYGNMTHGVAGASVTAHVSVPTKWTPPNSLTVCATRAHVTSRYVDQECRVFANGVCSCSGNNWFICGYGNPVKPVMQLAASTAATSVAANFRGLVRIVPDNVADCGTAPR